MAIIDGVIQNFNSFTRSLQANEDQFNENIKILNTFTNSTANYLNDIFTRHLILEQSFFLSQISLELEEYYNFVISSITLAKQNILHPQIVSPRNLFHELSNVVLQNRLKWPISLTFSNLYKYDKLYKLNVAYINNTLIFVIKIPLVEDMQYELYKMLPFLIPYNSSNIYSYVQPSFPYILLSTNKVYYALLENLEVCPTVDTSEHICRIKYVTRTAERPTCESTLMTSSRVGTFILSYSHGSS